MLILAGLPTKNLSCFTDLVWGGRRACLCGRPLQTAALRAPHPDPRAPLGPAVRPRHALTVSLSCRAEKRTECSSHPFVGRRHKHRDCACVCSCLEWTRTTIPCTHFFTSGCSSAPVRYSPSPPTTSLGQRRQNGWSKPGLPFAGPSNHFQHFLLGS
jgi:hypothetical protein